MSPCINGLGGDIVQYGWSNLVGQNRCFLALPIYWHVWSFKTCLICASDILGLFQKLLKSSLSMYSLCVHLLMLGNNSATASKWYSLSYFCKYL